MLLVTAAHLLPVYRSWGSCTRSALCVRVSAPNALHTLATLLADEFRTILEQSEMIPVLSAIYSIGLGLAATVIKACWYTSNSFLRIIGVEGVCCVRLLWASCHRACYSVYATHIYTNPLSLVLVILVSTVLLMENGFRKLIIN
ncbi:uncharacterized protein BO88DRAFT_249774 [Aspergillus vadensis CBS 113365]|uniref:Uncharacterized protein n=1 Tax=Aspergillus vadensis (strain CBS 113365 / IMI 142717 / IBT 24658) TaxID=1448311 RepID=A0A319BCM8_ASPVC|nr:hypothetical protein BO88DRAFT_249774 [Aspergillus vadensis CBS 113365]PYH70505.1 hypothetical protein BO88DRAFT_249774 [Aspergillus vadensis CBS 113365]